MTETTEGAKEQKKQKKQKKQKNQSRARCNHAMRESNSNFTTSRWSLWLDSIRSVSCFNLHPSSRPTAVKSPYDHRSKKLTSPKPHAFIRASLSFNMHRLWILGTSASWASFFMLVCHCHAFPDSSRALLTPISPTIKVSLLPHRNYDEGSRLSI
jgi:hypothetical protein